ncbi:hypothetical protein [Calothrix sp. PCC 7507]|jgi:hypothetical protein|uniref:hypothetical protein n=1 Tax=Calothrix sp. PCC 7507 TaxID=99598 RepID=UPI00029F3211|nr:hypothetical protein [Calothrix sp. PCC 7507]AFY30711.1 hypothetical protein Cal7507_0209 [Calothrix sp. PCC 7507]
MNLSPKAMRFMVEALEFRIAAYQNQLDTETGEGISDDEISDLTNDLLFLESLLQELQKALDVPVAKVF